LSYKSDLLKGGNEMSAIKLSKEQQNSRNRIEKILVQLKEDTQTNNLPDVESQALFDEMASISHQLHMSLNPSPTHHESMIKNRGMKADNPQFYRHIHPTEDLLNYLDDSAANDDPIDVTIGDEFYMSIHSNRWGHRDRYTLIRTPSGWDASFMSYSGSGNQEAEPIITGIMTQDSISYPRNIGSYMYSIWNRAKNEGLSHQEVQQLLDQLADWISLCEESAPRQILY